MIFQCLNIDYNYSVISANDLKTTPIDTHKSSIAWVGKKVTGQHSGTVGIKSGNLSFDDASLVGGEFVIDMTSLTATDVEGGMRDKLNGHLRSGDFFGVEANPTATLTFTSVKATDTGYSITADLVIKGISHPITFDASVSDHSATAVLVVDRTLYNVKYGSGKFFDGLGDKMIYDNFDLTVNLSF